MTHDEIEKVRKFLRGINDDDSWVDEICDLAIHGLEIENFSESFEIGRKHGLREAAVYLLRHQPPHLLIAEHLERMAQTSSQ